MTKEEFEMITRGALNDLVGWASLYLRQVLPRDKIILISHDGSLIEGLEAATKYLVNSVYLGPEEIKPCI